MASKYLGKQFDIHTGGQEHVPVHHTNEIAQSETAFGKKPWVKCWIHFGWLLSGGEKVSKSKGGLFTIGDLEEKGFNPLSFRYLTLTTHYKKPLNFSLENLEKAQKSYDRLKNIISKLKNDGKINKKYLTQFQKAINDDLEMPKALQALWGLLRDNNAIGKIETVKKMDEVLGLKLLKKDKISIPKEIKQFAEDREKARKEKNYKKADQLRDKINKLGYILEDKERGYIINKK